MIVDKKFLVRVVVLVDTDPKDHAAFPRDRLLQSIQGGSLFEARRAPGSPKIENDDLTMQVREMRRASDLHVKIFGFSAREARLALPVCGGRENIEHGRDQNQGDGA